MIESKPRKVSFSEAFWVSSSIASQRRLRVECQADVLSIQSNNGFQSFISACGGAFRTVTVPSAMPK